MPDENTNLSNDAVTPDEAENTDNSGGHMIPKTRFDEVNKARRDLEARLSEIEKAQADKEATELAEQNRFKELYEKAQAELETIKGIQTEAERYREALHATNQARIAGIPEDKRALIPDYDDPVRLGAWLDNAAGILGVTAKPHAPATDSGAGSSGGKSDNVKPLPDSVSTVLEAARRAGYSIDADNIRKRLGD
jgi:hypothetical protein